MDDNALLDPFTRMLEDVAPPEVVRAVERGADPIPIWETIAASGFLDLLTPERAGGVGMTLADGAPLFEAIGHHLTPVPVAETMIARALLAQAAVTPPTGPIVLATGAGGAVQDVLLASVAHHALVDTGEKILLLDRDGGWTDGILRWGDRVAVMVRPEGGLRPILGAVLAAQMAGIADRLLAMTVAYANDRVQFGRPIGRQQVVQQQLAVMAEQVALMRMAGRIGCSGALPGDLRRCAVAKAVASAAAVDVAAIAHAVHGAIGISEEHDLQLHTRRLHAMRRAGGSEAYWRDSFGRARFASDAPTTVAFARSITVTEDGI